MKISTQLVAPLDIANHVGIPIYEAQQYAQWHFSIHESSIKPIVGDPIKGFSAIQECYINMVKKVVNGCVESVKCMFGACSALETKL